jgi:hypothetical protein
MIDTNVYVTAYNGILVGTAGRLEEAYQLVDQHIDSQNAAGRALPNFYILYWRDEFGLAQHQNVIRPDSRKRPHRVDSR